MSHAQLGLGVHDKFVRSGDRPFACAFEQAGR